MATHEREITEPVDLCRPDGAHLDPMAQGWSRTPMHRANLAGGWGRTKRWDYWAILSDDLALAVTYGDVDYLGTVSVWWADLRLGTTGGHEAVAPGGRGMALPDRPGTEPLRFRAKGFEVDLVDEVVDGMAGTTITARWHEADGTDAALHARIDLPAGHESVNVVIPWSSTRFQFTSKHQARPARGTLRIGDQERAFGRPDGPSPAWGVLDVGRGRWPYRTRWNWGGGAGTATDGTTTVGLQFGGRWTVGTGFTENGVIVDGVATKIGAELRWDYDWDHPLRPWRVHHPDGSLDVTLRPLHDRHTKVEAVVLGTEVHQVFGWWTGHVTADDPGGGPGRRIEVSGICGFAEESRSRW